MHLSRDPDGKNLPLAAVCASAALVCTFPLHWYTHALRKGLAAGARAHVNHMYSGVLPALVSVAPVIVADHCVFRSVSSFVRKARPPLLNRDRAASDRAWELAAVVVAAGLSATVAGALVQPLKELSRRVAVQSVTSQTSPSTVAVLKQILAAGGPAELYRGYKTRALRYGICGAITKLAQQQLRETN
jgi:hypothetical protein